MDFLNLYNEVFDSDDKIKACGREKCKKLIKYCKKIDNYTFYGDLDTGRMDVDNIQKLKTKYCHDLPAFMELYNEIFDEKGNVNACGRQKCKELIEISDLIEPNVFHGDLENGYMSVDNIKSLKNIVLRMQKAVL